jgi:heme exporter protein C
MTNGRSFGGRDAATGVLLVAGAALGTWGLFSGLHLAPVERTLLMSQKIFYFHAPLGMATIVLTCVAAGAAIAYLWKRSPRADLLCEACMEVMVLSCAVVLVTGSLWAKPAWDDWFPWGEPRITSMLFLFLLGLIYAVMRSSVDEPERRARFSSVVAVVGALDAVLAYAAIHIWNTTHPRVITADGVALEPRMARAFLICIGACGILTAVVAQARFRVGLLRHEVGELEDGLADALDGGPA